jgi:hypothetical protein
MRNPLVMFFSIRYRFKLQQAGTGIKPTFVRGEKRARIGRKQRLLYHKPFCDTSGIHSN